MHGRPVDGFMIAFPELSAKGAEVVYGNLDEPDSIVKAFEGAYGAFGVTNCALLHFLPAGV